MLIEVTKVLQNYFEICHSTAFASVKAFFEQLFWKANLRLWVESSVISEKIN